MKILKGKVVSGLGNFSYVAPTEAKAIAAGASLIKNVLDEFKNSEASISQSIKLAFLFVIYLVEYLDTLNSSSLDYSIQQNTVN